jgi:thiosulfate dehydrogenase
MTRTGLVVVLGAVAAAAACHDQIGATEHGADLFADPGGLSSSTQNPVACASCHQTSETPDPARKDAGYDLFGVTARTAFWGGQTDTLRESIDVCLTFFMRSLRPLDPESEEGVSLWAFLESITPEGSPETPLPLTVVSTIQLVPLGDAGRGETLFEHACVRCHGQPHTGDGKIDEMAVTLPDYAEEMYPTLFPDFDPNEVVIEKVRHGRFYNTPGVMPLYSLEALSDAELGDLLAFLDL